MPAKNTKKGAAPTLRTRRSPAGTLIAYAKFNGRQVSFGPAGPDAQRRFDEHLSRWLANGRQAEVEAEPYRVEELVADYLDHARTRYFDAERNQPSGEYSNVCLALAPLDEHFAALPAAEFGGIALLELRQRLIDGGRLCRKQINARVDRIRRAFKWAAAMQRIPDQTFGSLRLVDGLRAGRTTARESAPVLPIGLAEVREVSQHLCPTVAGMVWFQWWTGCRPGEACALRWGMIDRRGPVWIATLERHKTAHRGRRRVLAIGPKAQECIRGLLVVDPKAFVFSPRRAISEQRAEKRSARRTKVPPSQQRRAELAQHDPDTYAEAYTVETMRRAIARGVRAANAARLRNAIDQVLRNRLDDTESATQRDRAARLSARSCVTERGTSKVTEDSAERIFGADRALTKEIVETCDGAPLLRPWGPNRLRHSAATRLRREEGLEAARVVLGHARAAVTEIYAEVDHERSREIMGRHG